MKRFIGLVFLSVYLQYNQNLSQLKYIKFLFLIQICLSIHAQVVSDASLPEYVAGIPRTKQVSVAPAARISIQAASTTTATCSDGAKGSVCAGTDCSTLLTCAINQATPIASTSCADLYPSSPYCNVGETSCSATSTDSTCFPTSDFVCLDTGYLPDPSNCSVYYYCGTDGKAQVYDCPAYYVYDTTTERCKLKQKSSDCGTIKCTGLKSYPAFVLHSANSAYYGLCTKSANGDIETYVLKCRYPDTFIYNVSTGVCQFQCKTDGQFADVDDCQKYILCYKSGSQYLSQSNNCPSGTGFNATTSACSPETTCP